MIAARQSWWTKRIRVLGIVALVGVFVGLALWSRPQQKLSPSDGTDGTYEKLFDVYGGHETLDAWCQGSVVYRATEERLGFPMAQVAVTEKFWLPEKYRREEEGTVLGRSRKSVSVINGRTRWVRIDRGPVLTQDGEIATASLPEFVALYHPFHLLQAGRELAVREDASLGADRGLLIKPCGETTSHWECHADLRTGLIREFQGELLSPISHERIRARYEYTNHRKTEFGIVPGRITGYLDERIVLDVRIVALELNKTHDAFEFEPLSDITKH